MDEKKDIENDVFSKFLDIPVNTNPFGRNRSGDRMYRRAERLIAAVFLMTNHIPDNEPLRIESRVVATSILAKTLACRDELRSTNSSAILEFQIGIRHLISLTRLMVFGGFLSGQNAEIVANAADELGTFISTANRSNLSESMVFSKDDFIDVPDYSNRAHKGQRDIRDRIYIKDIHSTSLIDATSSETSSASTTNTKAAGIIGILNSGGELSIKDIAANLPEYSEKTIQRELNHLIERGKVRRIGLKRWSRYALI